MALTALVVIAGVWCSCPSGNIQNGMRRFLEWVNEIENGIGELRSRSAASVWPSGLFKPPRKEVFQLMAVGKSSSEIEGELYIANGTLKSHTRRIYQKLGVHSRSEMMALLDDDAA